MNRMDRLQKALILKDLKSKMVLLTGPRQVGKTWLAKDIAASYKKALYLNYDITRDKKVIEEQLWLQDTDLLILDELHKMPDWKNYLKGLVDSNEQKMHILVTGSARLETYDRIGDSLAGRYFRHRLLPFSLSELKQVGNVSLTIDDLIQRGGFPEPLLTEDTLSANRWRDQYTNSLLSTDVFEIDVIHNLNAMHLVFNLLRERVGSPVSYQSIAEDVKVSPVTVKKYVEILESLYIVFRICPYSNNIARSLLKEPKIYFFDTGLLTTDDGAKLENLVALSLLKHCYAKQDYLAEDLKLYYLRTKDGDEVDFALVQDHVVKQMIEVKLSSKNLSRSLVKFNQKYHIPGIQLIKNNIKPHTLQDIVLDSAKDYLGNLFI